MTWLVFALRANIQAMTWLLTGGSQLSRLATSEEIEKMQVRLGPQISGISAISPRSSPMHRRYPSLAAKSAGRESIGFEMSTEAIERQQAAISADGLDNL